MTSDSLPHHRTDILIVEDSAVQAELLRRTLIKHGYQPRVASNGLEALDAVQIRKPQAVITDIAMPEMDGYALCSAIKQNQKLADLPVILLTSRTNVSDVFRGLEAGADEYIAKPWHEAELIRRVESLLAAAREKPAEGHHEPLRVVFQREHYTVRSDRRQILALLLSVLEDAVRQNDELVHHRQELDAANRALQQANAQLEQANRSKSDFLARMSHELRTPLHSIIGFSEILLDNGDTAPEATRTRFLGHILNAGQHLLQLINDILDLSKIEAGRMELAEEEFDVREVIRSVYDTVSPLAEKKGHALLLEIDPAVGLMVQDTRRFAQILFNLLSNAIKFTPDGGEILTRAAVESGWLEVAVSDTGIGIQAEDLDRILEEFHQVDSGYSRLQEGTGLGLALVQRLLHVMGGHLQVHSVPGAGSTFRFRLPLKPAGAPGNE